MIYYKTFIHQEEKEWVVLIHGAGGSSSIWYKQIRAYKEHFHVLLVDLRGHGKSNTNKTERKYTFKDVSKDVLDVMDVLHIEKAHFVGISLGTIIINTLHDIAPERIHCMILGGAVTRLTFIAKFLLTLGDKCKYIVPYMWIYELAAWAIMPRKRHKKSRILFIKEAKKLCQKEFIKWFKLIKEVDIVHKKTQHNKKDIPKLYIMGEEDYMFLPPVEKMVKNNDTVSLVVIKRAGHVCNVDMPVEFNEISLSFLKEKTKKQPSVTY